MDKLAEQENGLCLSLDNAEQQFLIWTMLGKIRDSSMNF